MYRHDVNSNQPRGINTVKENEQKFIVDFYKQYTNYAMTEDRINQLLDRDLVVTISKASYDEPSTALIEISGSPPKARILVGLSGADRLLMINNKVLPVDLEKDAVLRQMALTFLEENGYID